MAITIIRLFQTGSESRTKKKSLPTASVIFQIYHIIITSRGFTLDEPTDAGMRQSSSVSRLSLVGESLPTRFPQTKSKTRDPIEEGRLIKFHHCLIDR